MMVSDAPTTTFTLTIDGRTHTTEVYALDFDMGSAPGHDEGEEQARKDLAAFQVKASDLSWLPSGSVSDEGMYEPTGLRVYSGPYQPDENLHQSPIAWPLTPGLAEFGDAQDDALGGMRCGAVGCRRRRHAPPAHGAGEPAHAVDERRRALRAVVPAPPPGRVGLLSDRREPSTRRPADLP